jgi:hypothetical protein
MTMSRGVGSGILCKPNSLYRFSLNQEVFLGKPGGKVFLSLSDIMFGGTGFGPSLGAKRSFLPEPPLLRKFSLEVLSNL